jgi:four helix bundle protein
MDQTKGILQFNEQVRERTMKMAIEIRNLLATMQINPIDKPIVNQLIRSSTSVAANYRAASCSRSDAEFYSKICIVVEESDETKFWLDYLEQLKIIDESGISALRDEVDQLVRLFSTIKRKMKKKIGKVESSPRSQVSSPKI